MITPLTDSPFAHSWGVTPVSKRWRNGRRGGKVPAGGRSTSGGKGPAGGKAPAGGKGPGRGTGIHSMADPVDPGGRRWYDPRVSEGATAATLRLMRGHEPGSMDERDGSLDAHMPLRDPVPLVDPTPIEEAQEIMYEAFRHRGEERVELARRALGTSRDCADAHVVLAEETAKTPGEALALYEAGVAAGERALTREWIERGAGGLWGSLKARPYMRALSGRAATLWTLGRREGSIAQGKEALRLDAEDHMGNRYILLCHLIGAGRDGEARELLERYEGDGSATWAYSRALLLYRAEGASRAAGERLDEAFEVNPHVPLQMFGYEPMPDELLGLSIVGDQDEATLYLFDSHEAWLATGGSPEWVHGRMLRLLKPPP